MVKLWCGFYGEGSVFSVEIERDADVEALKMAIADRYRVMSNRVEVYPATLRPYLAKKNGAWLKIDPALVPYLEQGRKEDSDYTVEMISGLRLNNPLYFGDFKLGEGEIHVLVVLPEAASPLSVAVAVPIGPEVDVQSVDHLLAFLEGDMTNKEAIVSRPHILYQESLEFRLVGREQAIDTASKCFKKIIKHASSTASDRIQLTMPVCSGMSGLGKTRMLEESGTILERMQLDPKHVTRVIVPYYNGCRPQPVEESMPIEASFSWRLLFRIFLDNNCSLSFKKWFKSRLPRTGGQLTLQSAVEVIERKLRKKLPEPATLYLFVSVDDCQKIKKIGARRKDPNTSLLRELVEVIGDLLFLQSSSLILLPMFAGTDWGAIESIANFSNYVTERLPMDLLSMDQVFSIVESNASYTGLLNHARIWPYLFALGGVPRWVVQYLIAVKTTCVQGNPVSLDNIDKCFVGVWEKFVACYFRSLEFSQFVRLAAFAVSGQTVDPHDTFDGNLKWSTLRDSSRCLLMPRISPASGKFDVRVPYTLLENIGSRREEMATEAERNFVSALHDLTDEVDSTMFKLQPWQSWGVFGACFYAVRINALLALGRSSVTLRDLLPGTLMSRETSAISVKLVPSRVIRCAGAFGASTPPLIPRKGNQLETIDWTSGGYIVVNDDGGAGVDIFFALKDATTGNTVVFVDQRKRQFGKFEPSHASEYLGKLSVCPDFLVASGARLVRGIMNSVAPSNLATFEAPHDCFILSRNVTEQFYGTLAYHPACSPVVCIKSACRTALKTVFKGDAGEVDEIVDEIIRKRPSGGCTSEELQAFTKAKRLKVEVDMIWRSFCRSAESVLHLLCSFSTLVHTF